MTLLVMPKVQAMKRFITESQVNTLIHLFSTILMMKLSERHFWDLEAEGCYTLQTLLRSKFVGGSSSKVVPTRELKEKSQWKRDAGESLGSPEGLRGHGDYSWVQWPKLGSLKNTNDKRLRLSDIEDEAFQPSEDVLKWKQRQI